MHRRTALLALSALAVAACSSSDAAPPPPSTVPLVGTLPSALAADPTTPSSTAASVPTDRSDVGSVPSVPGAPALDVMKPIGDQVAGNRLIVIGDSVLASLSSRYSDQLCTYLVWRRWALEVDAEVGQHIEFGRRVLAERGSAGWDAAVVMLGNNYDGDPQAFATELGALLDELGDIPVVLLTVTRFRPIQDQVNYVLHATAAQRPNVRLVDWQARTAAADADELLSGDGLHLSDRGQVALAATITSVLGLAPRGERGACLPSKFTDDSAGPATGVPRRATTTTAPRANRSSNNRSRTTVTPP
jgi:hypothetical protein